MKNSVRSQELWTPPHPIWSLSTKKTRVATKLAFLTATDLLSVRFHTFVSQLQSIHVSWDPLNICNQVSTCFQILSVRSTSLHICKKNSGKFGCNIFLELEWLKYAGVGGCRKNKFENWTVLHAQGGVLRSHENWSQILLAVDTTIKSNSSDKKGVHNNTQKGNLTKKNNFYIDYWLGNLLFVTTFPALYCCQSLRTRGKLHPSFEFCDGVYVFRVALLHGYTLQYICFHETCTV